MRPNEAMSEPPDWRSMATLADIDETALRASCRRRRFAKGEVIFHEGDPAGAFHMIDKGRVVIRLTTPLGETAIVDVLSAGDTFGEQALVDGSGHRTATVTAVEKVETLSLDAQQFESIRRAHPAVDRFLLMVVAGRLRAMNQRLLDALYLPADVRLLRCVSRLATIFPADSIPITQGDIASMAGVTRSTANRLLRHAHDSGLIAITRAHLAVLDEPALRRRAGLA